MRIQNNPSFTQVDDSEVVWKFMDFTKFLSILENKALYFNGANKFRDLFEGTLPKRNGSYPLFENLRKTVYMNCWHVNEYESAGMWDLYNQSFSGIAIKSTGKGLRYAFTEFTDYMILAKVNYIDYQTDIIDLSNVYRGFFNKRISFRHEQEARIIFEHPDNVAFEDGIPPDGPVGYNIQADLNLLIDSIYVSPDSPVWFFELVNKVVNRYRLTANVIHSQLYKIR